MIRARLTDAWAGSRLDRKLGVLVALVLLAAVAGVAVLTSAAIGLRAGLERRSNVQDEIDRVIAIRSAALDVQTGLRNYLRTRDVRHLEAYAFGRTTLERRLAEIERNPDDPEPVSQLSLEVAAYLSGWAEPRLEAVRAGTQPPSSGGPDEGDVRFVRVLRAIEALSASAERRRLEVRRQVDADAATLLWLPWLALAVLFAAVLGLRLGMRRSVIEPVARLQAATRRLARGAYDTRVPARGDDEIGALAADFNRAAAELQQRQADQDAFVVSFSHHLRQPLVTIHNFAQMLADAVRRNDADEAAHLASRLGGNVSRMNALLDELGAYASAGAELEPARRQDLGEAVQAAASDLEARRVERGARFETADEWPRVWFPGGGLRLVLRRTLDNALRLAGRPDLEPVVRVEWEERDGIVFLRVEDNGPGLEPALRDNAFALLAPLDPHDPGAGAGLALVRRVLERHGGTAVLEPRGTDGGTRAILTLPAERRWRRGQSPTGVERRLGPNPNTVPVSRAATRAPAEP